MRFRVTDPAFPFVAFGVGGATFTPEGSDAAVCAVNLGRIRAELDALRLAPGRAGYVVVAPEDPAWARARPASSFVSVTDDNGEPVSLVPDVEVAHG